MKEDGPPTFEEVSNVTGTRRSQIEPADCYRIEVRNPSLRGTSGWWYSVWRPDGTRVVDEELVLFGRRWCTWRAKARARKDYLERAKGLLPKKIFREEYCVGGHDDDKAV